MLILIFTYHQNHQNRILSLTQMSTYAGTPTKKFILYYIYTPPPPTPPHHHTHTIYTHMCVYVERERVIVWCECGEDDDIFGYPTLCRLITDSNCAEGGR